MGEPLVKELCVHRQHAGWRDAGHFVYEDRAAEYAALVAGWWRGGYEQA